METGQKITIALLAVLFIGSLDAGTFQCPATCLSKIASVVSVAANGKSLVAGAKKIRHPKKKGTGK